MSNISSDHDDDHIDIDIGDNITKEEDDDDKTEAVTEKQIKENTNSCQMLKPLDSLDLEAANLNHAHASKGIAWSVIFQLAFQSIGIVYGDLGTSPLYVFPSTFPDGVINHEDDIIGALSLIFYTITLLPLIKYTLIVLRATDNGEGGTFALYSLICRYAKVGLLPSQEAADREVSNFNLELPNNRRFKRASCLKSKLEKSSFAKFLLLLVTMLGTSMVIGDGILTPCISVLSAVGGIQIAASSMTEGWIVWISVVILVLLFMVQRYGTDKVGYAFAPILCIWFAFLAGIGVYNFVKYDPSVIKAINPKYIVDYFRRNKKQAWISLGGTILSITGTEALFADVGHFTVRSIQISMCCVTYPAIILAYVGQSSFLRKHKFDVLNIFYKSIPGPLYWPMFFLAVLASIIGSQAMISGTFSIIQQSLSLGCFPRVKVVHTSAQYKGQVFIPEANYLLMLACVAVTLGFKNPANLASAYGIAVVLVMLLTSSFLVLIMIMIWKTQAVLIISYILVIGSIELGYLSSLLYKFNQGGYLPLAFALVLMGIMYTWNDVYRRKYYYELENQISPEKLEEIAASTNVYRIPGLALFYSELVHGLPPIFQHYVANVPALHSVLVFISIKSMHISKVPEGERFLFSRVYPNELNMFRCVVRYGYTDVHNEKEPFERTLAKKLKNFIKDQYMVAAMASHNEPIRGGNHVGEEEVELHQEAMKGELELLGKAWSTGVIHLVGEHEVVASKGANIGKRILINYAYHFLKNNLRHSINKVFDIPQKRLLKVGMTYEL